MGASNHIVLTSVSIRLFILRMVGMLFLEESLNLPKVPPGREVMLPPGRSQWRVRRGVERLL